MQKVVFCSSSKRKIQQFKRCFVGYDYAVDNEIVLQEKQNIKNVDKMMRYKFKNILQSKKYNPKYIYMIEDTIVRCKESPFFGRKIGYYIKKNGLYNVICELEQFKEASLVSYCLVFWKGKYWVNTVNKKGKFALNATGEHLEDFFFINLENEIKKISYEEYPRINNFEWAKEKIKYICDQEQESN